MAIFAGVRHFQLYPIMPLQKIANNVNETVRRVALAYNCNLILISLLLSFSEAGGNVSYTGW